MRSTLDADVLTSVEPIKSPDATEEMKKEDLKGAPNSPANYEEEDMMPLKVDTTVGDDVLHHASL